MPLVGIVHRRVLHPSRMHSMMVAVAAGLFTMIHELVTVSCSALCRRGGSPAHGRTQGWALSMSSGSIFARQERRCQLTAPDTNVKLLYRDHGAELGNCDGADPAAAFRRTIKVSRVNPQGSVVQQAGLQPSETNTWGTLTCRSGVHKQLTSGYRSGLLRHFTTSKATLTFARAHRNRMAANSAEAHLRCSTAP